MSDRIERAIRALVQALREEIANANRPDATSRAGIASRDQGDPECDDDSLPEICTPVGGSCMSGGFVYFIQCKATKAIKIGHTRDVAKRLHNLQLGSAPLLGLVAMRWVSSPVEEESRLHERYSALRLRGEWFRLSPDLLAEIESARFVVQRILRGVQ